MVDYFLSLDWVQLLREINWAEVVLTSAFYAIIPLLLLFYKIIKGWRSNLFTEYVGDYYCYNYTFYRHIESQISEKYLKIKLNIFGNPKLILNVKEEMNLTYKGYMEVMKNNIYMTFRGKTHEEKVNFIFHEPMTNKFSVLFGIFLGVSVDYEPYSGKIIASKKKLEPEEAEIILGKLNYILMPRDTLDGSIGV